MLGLLGAIIASPLVIWLLGIALEKQRPEVIDLCESCQHSWIVEGPQSYYNKKCMFSGCWLGKVDITDCNCYLKIGHKGKVTYHDSEFEDFENLWY